ARRELEIELQEIELDKECSERSSQVGAYEAWLRETSRIGTTVYYHGEEGSNGGAGHQPLTPTATAGAQGARSAPAPLRYDFRTAYDTRGRQPWTPVTPGCPPEYDRTWAVDQAAAQDREYAEWRRAVEYSITTHHEAKFRPLYKLGEIAGTTSAAMAKPPMDVRFTPLIPNQEEARKAIPKELPIFSGAVEEWPLFIATYERTTALCGFSDDENLVRLQRALRGPALDSVDHLLLLPNGLANAMEILRVEYGRPDLIVDSIVEKIRRLPPVRTERLETLAAYGKMLNFLPNVV
uniref:Uncharacterized protein n=1 Tax=Anopheles epiroticus TaxID=199890 RepID=A0A182PX49_9DIPT